MLTLIPQTPFGQSPTRRRLYDRAIEQNVRLFRPQSRGISGRTSRQVRLAPRRILSCNSLYLVGVGLCQSNFLTIFPLMWPSPEATGSATLSFSTFLRSLTTCNSPCLDLDELTWPWVFNPLSRKEHSDCRILTESIAGSLTLFWNRQCSVASGELAETRNILWAHGSQLSQSCWLPTFLWHKSHEVIQLVGLESAMTSSTVCITLTVQFVGKVMSNLYWGTTQIPRQEDVPVLV